eukprot:jgi/Tetstr1/430398/TSEL_020208.t1
MCSVKGLLCQGDCPQPLYVFGSEARGALAKDIEAAAAVPGHGAYMIREYASASSHTIAPALLSDFTQKPIPATPADGLEGDDAEDDPSPGFPAKSPSHAAFIDPRDWIDYMPRAYAESMRPVGLANPGLWNPRNDE